ncbi:hypothetical protein AG1IA_05954 [Rhizoctonia solani AG-1 IA]|uniref:Uncharacterized protein n=1 Tax=Thanatephorus cucumeris (strain AG1-IA) TaxID=983506 RepID=L8WPT0_THACA|nr:hypothetical protein AG1IA_05954 [Rhizoctonia solani AG-1 IA]
MATTAAPLASLNSLGSNTRSPSAGPSKYRGAVVEMAKTESMGWVPRVLDSRRKPVGYINVADLKTKWEAGSANPSDLISNYMTKFARGTGVEYTVITPETPLEELEAFLETTDFAIGGSLFVIYKARSLNGKGGYSYRLESQICVGCGDQG